MRVTLAVAVTARTEARLYAAAAEHGLALRQHASVCIEAAARLWCLDAATSAIPARRRGAASASGSETIELRLTARAIAVMGYIAVDRGVPLGEILAGVLEAAVASYDPPPLLTLVSAEPPRRNTPVPGAGGIPHRAPFDPKRYAGSRALEAAIAGGADPGTLTERMMGDPAAARAIACARPLPAVRSKPQSRRRPPEGEGCK